MALKTARRQRAKVGLAAAALIALGSLAAGQTAAPPEAVDPDVANDMRALQRWLDLLSLSGGREPATPPAANVEIDVMARQWTWRFRYRTQTGLVAAPNAAPPRLIAPVGAVVRLNLTSEDVIHSLHVPAFGLKLDAVPGRIASGWFRTDKPGIYAGACSELCGVGHPKMRFEIEVLPKDEFEARLPGALEPSE